MSAVLEANVSAAKNRKVFTGTAARALKLLGAEVTQSQAAAALEVSESYISQLLDDPDFLGQVEEALTQRAVTAVEIDGKYVDIEKACIDRLHQNVGFITNTDQLLRVAKFANEAKKKLEKSVLPESNPDKIAPVTLLMPTTIVNNYIMNPNREIVGVGGRDMVTLNSNSMSSLVEQRKKNLLQERVREITTITEEEIPNGKRKQLTADDLNNL